MIKRILGLFGKEVRGLHEAAYLLALFGIFSSILALVRDRVLAGAFGAGEMLDVYYSAFRIPDILFFTVALSVSVFVLIPKLEKYKELAKKQELIGHTLSAFSLVMIITSVVLMIFMPEILKKLFPTLISGSYGEEFLFISRVMLLQPLLLGISNIISAVTQIQRRYFIYASAPLLYNSGIIFGAIVLVPEFGLRGLVAGVLIGALSHILIQIPFVAGGGYLRRITFNINWKLIYMIVRESFPRTVAMSFNHIAFLVLTVIAVKIGEGSVSVFQLAFNLHMAPLAIIGASYSVAAFPKLAKFFSDQDMDKFINSIMSACRHIIFWSVPAVILLIVLRAQIVRTVLGSGEFDWSDTMLTAAILALLAVSIIFQAISLLLVRGYYAASKTFVPFFVNALSALLMIIFAYGFVKLFQENHTFKIFFEEMLRVSDLSGSAILMLALAYSTSAIVNMVLLTFLFSRDFKIFNIKKLFAITTGPLGASLLLGVVTYYSLMALAPILPTETAFGIFMQGFLAGIAGLIAWALLLFVAGNKELMEVIDTARNRFWKKAKITADIDHS